MSVCLSIYVSASLSASEIRRRIRMSELVLITVRFPAYECKITAIAGQVHEEKKADTRAEKSICNDNSITQT